MFHKRINFVKPTGAKNTLEEREAINNCVPYPSNEDSKKTTEQKKHKSNEEAFIFHSTSFILHFIQAGMLDDIKNLNVGFFICVFSDFIVHVYKE